MFSEEQQCKNAKLNPVMKTDRTVIDGLMKEKHNPKYSDFIVTVDEKEFHCHKVILAATSEFFDGMFSSGMKESLDGQTNLQGISSETFEKILSWMYHNEPIRWEENAHHILLAANQLGIQGLLFEGVEYLTSTLSVNNWYGSYEIGWLLYFTDLKDDSWNYMTKNFDKIHHSDVANLSLDEMKCLITDPDLVTMSEDIVGQAVLSWVSGGGGLEGKPLQDENDDECISTMSSSSSHTAGLKAIEYSGRESKSIEQFSQSATNKEFCKPAGGITVGGDSSLFGVSSIDAGSSPDQTQHSPRSDNADTRKDDAASERSSISSTKPDSAEMGKRSFHLAQLLSLCKYLLFSSRFVRWSLESNPLFNADPKCQDMLREIVQHQLEPDTHQYWCPPAAVHRPSSNLRSVILFVFENKLCIREANGHDDLLTVPNISFPESTNLSYKWCSAFRNSIYFELSELLFSKPTLYFYNSEFHKTVKCDECQTGSTAHAMMPVGNALVALRSSRNEGFTIEQLPCIAESNWRIIGHSKIKDMTAVCVVDVGCVLALFWKNMNSKHITVECFHLVKRSSFILPAKFKASDKLVSFKKEHNVFVLHDDGILWKLQHLDDAPYLDIKREGQLWKGRLQLQAALIVGEVLHIYHNTSDQDRRAKIDKFKVTVEGVFVDQKFEYFGNLLGAVHAVVHSKALQTAK